MSRAEGTARYDSDGFPRSQYLSLMSVPPVKRNGDRSISPVYNAQTLWPFSYNNNNNNNKKKEIRFLKSPNLIFTCAFDRGGVVLPHSTACRYCVSIFHMDTSLLPWTADKTQDFSVGCRTTFLTLAPAQTEICEKCQR